MFHVKHSLDLVQPKLTRHKTLQSLPLRSLYTISNISRFDGAESQEIGHCRIWALPIHIIYRPVAGWVIECSRWSRTTLLGNLNKHEQVVEMILPPCHDRSISRSRVLIFYLPTQNSRKIISSISSRSTRPVILPSARVARRKSSAASSGRQAF
jgi:hypothetical protein